jgi:hypothetical protein
LSEHHLTKENIQTLTIDNYNCSRKNTVCGGACIFIHEVYQFKTMDLDKYCCEQDFEVCAIRSSHRSVNLCVLSVNLDTYLMKVEEVLNMLFRSQVNLVLCGDLSVNVMSSNTNKYKIYPY